MNRHTCHLFSTLALALVATGISACAGKESLPGKPLQDTTVSTASNAKKAVTPSSKVSSSNSEDTRISAIIDYANPVKPRALLTDEENQSKVTNSKEKTNGGSPTRYVFLFGTDQTTLVDADLKELGIHAKYLAAHPNTVVSIDGHADNRGSREYNDKLSHQRAENVSTLLVKLGVDRSQIVFAGHGEDIPVTSEIRWQENRRVELQYVDDYMISTR